MAFLLHGYIPEIEMFITLIGGLVMFFARLTGWLETKYLSKVENSERIVGVHIIIFVWLTIMYYNFVTLSNVATHISVCCMNISLMMFVKFIESPFRRQRSESGNQMETFVVMILCGIVSRFSTYLKFGCGSSFFGGILVIVYNVVVIILFGLVAFAAGEVRYSNFRIRMLTFACAVLLFYAYAGITLYVVPCEQKTQEPVRKSAQFSYDQEYIYRKFNNIPFGESRIPETQPEILKESSWWDTIQTALKIAEIISRVLQPFVVIFSFTSIVFAIPYLTYNFCWNIMEIYKALRQGKIWLTLKIMCLGVAAVENEKRKKEKMVRLKDIQEQTKAIANHLEGNPQQVTYLLGIQQNNYTSPPPPPVYREAPASNPSTARSFVPKKPQAPPRRSRPVICDTEPAPGTEPSDPNAKRRESYIKRLQKEEAALVAAVKAENEKKIRDTEIRIDGLHYLLRQLDEKQETGSNETCSKQTGKRAADTDLKSARPLKMQA